MSALVLFALSLSEAFRYQTLNSTGGGLSLALEMALFRAGDAITRAAPYLLGLTFLVGLVAALRETGPLALAPSVLMLAVGAVVTLASTASFYEVANLSDMSPYLAVELAAWAVVPYLTAALLLSAVLFVTVMLKAHRAS